jgi:hypothetical protein
MPRRDFLDAIDEWLKITVMHARRPLISLLSKDFNCHGIEQISENRKAVDLTEYVTDLGKFC